MEQSALVAGRRGGTLNGISAQNQTLGVRLRRQDGVQLGVGHLGVDGGQIVQITSPGAVQAHEGAG